MPTITSQALSLQPAPGGAGVTADVTYTARFSAIEVFLMGNGLVVEERIQLIGDDEARTGGGAAYISSPEALTLAPGETELVRSRQLVIPRASLQEDPSQPIYRYITIPSWTPGQPPKVYRYRIGATADDDELLARIELSYAGLEQLTRADTTISVLAG